MIKLCQNLVFNFHPTKLRNTGSSNSNFYDAVQNLASNFQISNIIRYMYIPVTFFFTYWLAWIHAPMYPDIIPPGGIMKRDTFSYMHGEA